MIFLRPGHADSAMTVHGFNILQPCLSLGINKTSPRSSDKLASMSPAGQTSKFQALSRSQKTSDAFQCAKMCQVFGFRTQLYPRWKPSSSQTAASRDPEIKKDSRCNDATSCDSFPSNSFAKS